MTLGAYGRRPDLSARVAAECRPDSTPLSTGIRLPSMFAKTYRRTISWLMAGMLLFAHAIGVAQACASLEMTPAMAFSQDEMVTHDCDGPAPANAPNPNACLQHCTGGDQTAAYPIVIIAAMPNVAVLTVEMAPERLMASDRAEACEPHSPDPPRSIRFCSFQL